MATTNPNFVSDDIMRYNVELIKWVIFHCQFQYVNMEKYTRFFFIMFIHPSNLEVALHSNQSNAYHSGKQKKQ